MKTIKELFAFQHDRLLKDFGQAMRPVKRLPDGSYQERDAPVMRVKWDKENSCLLCCDADAVIVANMIGDFASIDGEIIEISNVEAQLHGILKVFAIPVTQTQICSAPYRSPAQPD